MTTGGRTRDLDYRSSTLPGGTFARAIFDNQLVRLSDRGGASQLIGAAWSETTAEVLSGWLGEAVPAETPALAGSVVTAVHRLDTLPGVAARASRVGLKNPDYLVYADRDGAALIFGVDAKFSVETAKPVQVAATTTADLFEHDARLTGMLPPRDPDARFVSGLFISPDYPLTHAMFRHKVGHRRLTVSRGEVVLAEVDAIQLLGQVSEEAVVETLGRLDDLPFPAWESLLAAQYYFRLERAIVGLVVDERKPLLGTAGAEATGEEVAEELEMRARRAESAWELVLDWDRDVERIRRQRQALHQVIGSPLSSSELRDLSDAIMDNLGLRERPSRNQVRKALGGRFTADVLDRVGVIVPPVADFPAELERVGAVAREVSEAYNAEIRAIVEEIILELGGPGEA